jgi:hypothetical protein
MRSEDGGSGDESSTEAVVQLEMVTTMAIIMDTRSSSLLAFIALVLFKRKSPTPIPHLGPSSHTPPVTHHPVADDPGAR